MGKHTIQQTDEQRCEEGRPGCDQFGPLVPDPYEETVHYTIVYRHLCDHCVQELYWDT